MNFSSMEYFIAVAEERSFTQASRRLNVTQQTLSAHVANMERELGVRLVNRKVPLTLTYAGEVLLGYARRIETDRRSMVQEFADIAGDRRGQLAIGIGSTRGHLLLPPTIASFRRENPGVNVLLAEGENDEIIEWLRAGSIDMAVATVPQGMPGIETRPLRREQLVLLVSKELLRERYGYAGEHLAQKASATHNIAPLTACPLLMLGRHDREGDLSHRIVERSGVDAPVAVVSENSETLVALAVQGVGACFVERGVALSMLDAHLRDEMCLVDLGPEARIDLSIAWRMSRHVWSVIGDFAQAIVEQVQQQERA